LPQSSSIQNIYPFCNPLYFQPNGVQIPKVQPQILPSTMRKMTARKIEGKIWTEENDENLLKIAKSCKCDWRKVSRKFKGKSQKITPHFLKLRYKELINAPVQRKRKFTHVEDLKLIKYFEKYGSNWDKISDHFLNRNSTMLKNRFYSHIKKKDLSSVLRDECQKIEGNGQIIDELPESEDSSEEFQVLVDGDNKVLCERALSPFRLLNNDKTEIEFGSSASNQFNTENNLRQNSETRYNLTRIDEHRGRLGASDGLHTGPQGEQAKY